MDELLPPPPKKEQAPVNNGGDGLLPPPPKKKMDAGTGISSETQSQPSQESGEPSLWQQTKTALGDLVFGAPLNTAIQNKEVANKYATEKAVEASKKTSASVTTLKQAQDAVQGDLAWDAIRANNPSLGNIEQVAQFDDQSGKYVPKDAFTVNADGNVQNQYTKEQLDSFDRTYRNAQRAATRDLNETPETMVAKRAANVAQLDAAKQQYQANVQELNKSFSALQELQKDELKNYGVTDAFMDGMAQTNAAVSLTLKAPQASDEDLINELEGYYIKQGALEKPQSMANTAAEVLGGQAIPLTATIGASLLTGGVGGGAVAIATGGAQGYGGNLMQGYMQARAQGQDPMQALATAKSFALHGAGTGAIEGGVGFINPFLKTGGLANKTLVQGVKSALVDAGIDGTVAMGMQVANNQYGQSLGLETNTLDGVLDQGAGEVAFSLGINALFGGAKKLAPKIHQQITFGLANSDVPSIQQAVDEAVKAGVVDAAKGQQVMDEIITTKKAVNKMPENLTEEQKFDLTPKMKEKDALTKQLETADDAFKPVIEGKIETLNREIQEEIGAPLTIKEQKAYETLQARKGDSEKPLTASEKSDLKHYEAREKKAEKVAEMQTEEAINNLADRIAKGEQITAAEDLQLQANNAEKLEAALKERAAKEVAPTKTYEVGDVVDLEPTITTPANENITTSEGADAATQGGTVQEDVTGTPDAEQVRAEQTQVAQDAAMGTGETVSVENAANVFEEHSAKRGNFAKDKVLSKFGNVKERAVSIIDNFDSMVSDLQALSDKGDIDFRIDC